MSETKGVIVNMFGIQFLTKPELTPIISAIRNVQPAPAVPDGLTADLGNKFVAFLSVGKVMSTWSCF